MTIQYNTTVIKIQKVKCEKTSLPIQNRRSIDFVFTFPEAKGGVDPLFGSLHEHHTYVAIKAPVEDSIRSSPSGRFNPVNLIK